MNKKIRNITFNLAVFCCMLACSDFVEIGPPRTELIKSTVFGNEETATAALMDVYSQMARDGFASGNVNSITFAAALSSDELMNFNIGVGQGQTLVQVNDNTLTPNNPLISSLWSELYRTIYKANLLIEGATASSELSESFKAQIIGEAKFIRAFCHFYLVNLWGDVPLVLATDYRTNQSIGRSPKSIVYQQIITDLADAQNFLTDNYSSFNNERVRPNKFAATALLARAYLYTNDWSNAEAESSKIIDNITDFSLPTDLNNVFQKNSQEAIWQFSSVYPANEAFAFLVTQTSRKAALRAEFLNAFESGDLRNVDWIGSVTDGDNTFYYPRKYKGINYSSITEYSTPLRLGEQYLIRAEARANQGDIQRAQEDLNKIRNRAGLGNTPASDMTSLLQAIAAERRIELFTEWGHRWLDLKRSNTVDSVLSSLKTLWQPHAALYPIPESQILTDINMKGAQNPGY